MRIEREQGTAAPPNQMVRQEAEAIGRRVRDARRELGLDQKDVAFAANVSPRTVFSIEKGKATVRLDMLMRVLAVVGLRLTPEARGRTWSPRTSRRG